MRYQRIGTCGPTASVVGLGASHFGRVCDRQQSRFAQQRGISMVSLAVGWLAAQPCVGPVITGATTPEQIRANAAAGEWVPSPDDVIALGEFNLV
jgi:aryl-alcohol dehydrogenase-like predicted oxidoreductase